MNFNLLRQIVASLTIALSILSGGCTKGDTAIPIEVKEIDLGCGERSFQHFCEGSFILPLGGRAGTKLTLQFSIDNNHYLDALLEQEIWTDSIASITAKACIIESDERHNTDSYECGGGDYPQTCTRVKPLPAIKQVTLWIVDPANAARKVELGKWDENGKSSLDFFPLNGTNVKSVFYPQPPLNRFLVEAQITLDESVQALLVARVKLGFCVQKKK